jgi:polyisoprenoid-binding protein YceI
MSGGRRGRFVAGAVAAGVALGLVGVPFAGGDGAAAVASASAQSEGAERYSVDNVHSMVVFKIKHAGVAWQYGRFNTIEGTFNIDVEDPDRSVLRAAVRTESVDTNSDARDNHLRSADFFNASEYPVISFEASSFRAGEEEDQVIATGTLTMLGESKEIEVPITKTGEGDVGRGYKQGMHATVKVERSEFGMTKYLDGSLGDEVTLMISFEGNRQ